MSILYMPEVTPYEKAMAPTVQWVHDSAPTPSRHIEPPMDYMPNRGNLKICSKDKIIVELEGKKYVVELPEICTTLD